MEPSVIKSAGRTLALLEYLGEARAPVAMSEVAAALAIPQSSASVLLKTFAQLGYLTYDGATRRYRATLRIGLLGEWVPQTGFANSRITETMEDIAQATGEAVLLGQQNGAMVQYVHVVPSSHSVQLRIPVGTERPMTCAATGMMLLTRKADPDVRAITRRNNAEASDPRHRVNELDLLEVVRCARADGFARTSGNMTPNAAVIAVLLPSAKGEADLSIGVGGPSERIDAAADHILGVLRETLGIDR